MRSGDPVDAATMDSLQKRGLAQINADGSITMSTAGRKLMSAANSGDADKAKQALADAAKPGKGGKKGGKGGKAKPTAAQKLAQKKLEEGKARDETFTALEDQIGVDNTTMQALAGFDEGGDLDDATAAILEDVGLVERGSDGAMRMTSSGRSILSASTKGDTRKVLDVASRARERVTKKREREAKRQERLEEQREELETQIEELETRLTQIAGVGRSDVERQRVAARIGQLQAELEEMDEKEVGVSAGPFEVKAGGTDNYRRMIRSAVRGLWSGTLSFDDFWSAMSSAINIGLTGAWHAGARECGIRPDELSQQERAMLAQRITYEHNWITGYANAIESNSRAAKGKLAPLYSRAEIWIGRWDGVRSEARAMACADKKLKWVLGEADHCSSCLKLSGKIKRGSFWAERNIYPRIHDASYLECGGWKCQCSLVQTDEPLSKGPLPNLP
jgi:hypothetical protein